MQSIFTCMYGMYSCAVHSAARRIDILISLRTFYLLRSWLVFHVALYERLTLGAMGPFLIYL